VREEVSICRPVPPGDLSSFRGDTVPLPSCSQELSVKTAGVKDKAGQINPDGSFGASTKLGCVAYPPSRQMACHGYVGKLHDDGAAPSSCGSYSSCSPVRGENCRPKEVCTREYFPGQHHHSTSFWVDCIDLADFKCVFSSPKQSLAPNRFRDLGLGGFLPDDYTRNAIAFNWALHSTCHPVLYVKPSHQLGTDAADTVLPMASK
jgi:hypothetical protein